MLSYVPGAAADVVVAKTVPIGLKVKTMQVAAKSTGNKIISLTRYDGSNSNCLTQNYGKWL